MMAKMAADGRVLAMHNYNIIVDQGCRDTGQYEVAQTLWERQPAR
jgi:hypothetical protein